MEDLSPMFFKNKSNLRRFFAFGCSMTRYHYPTWADIIGRQFDHYENWGRPGSGNLYILNSVMECHQRNRLTPDDFVVVMWTGLSRIDSYQINEWSHFHNMILDQQNSDMPISCVDGYEIIGYAYIAAMQNILENLGVQHRMLHITAYDRASRAGRFYKKYLDRVPEYRPERNVIYYSKQNSETREQITNLYQRLAGKDWPPLNDLLSGNFQIPNWLQPEISDFFTRIQSDRRFSFVEDEVDCHPLPTQHLACVLKHFPEIKVPDEDRRWLEDIEKKVLAGERYEFNRHLPKTRL